MIGTRELEFTFCIWYKQEMEYFKFLHKLDVSHYLFLSITWKKVIKNVTSYGRAILKFIAKK